MHQVAANLESELFHSNNLFSNPISNFNFALTLELLLRHAHHIITYRAGTILFAFACFLVNILTMCYCHQGLNRTVEHMFALLNIIHSFLILRTGCQHQRSTRRSSQLLQPQQVNLDRDISVLRVESLDWKRESIVHPSLFILILKQMDVLCFTDRQCPSLF